MPENFTPHTESQDSKPIRRISKYDTYDLKDPKDVIERNYIISIDKKLNPTDSQVILVNKPKFKQFFSKINANKPDKLQKLQEDSIKIIIESLVSSVVHSKNLLKPIINQYFGSINIYERMVAEEALNYCNFEDNNFYQKVYENSNDLDIKFKALKKVKDQVYLMKLITTDLHKDDTPSAKAVAIAIYGISDRELLQKIITDRKVHPEIERAAKERLNLLK